MIPYYGVGGTDMPYCGVAGRLRGVPSISSYCGAAGRPREVSSISPYAGWSGA